MAIKKEDGFSLLSAAESELSVLSSLAALREPPTADWVLVTVEDRAAENELLRLEAQLGNHLLVSEIWQKILLRAGIFVSSAICGGTLCQRLEDAEAATPGRCWLLPEQVQMRFPLPCPDGCGTELTDRDLEQVLASHPSFFSEELCCRYAYDIETPYMVLYDTEETMQQKLALAKEVGFLGAVWV